MYRTLPARVISIGAAKGAMTFNDSECVSGMVAKVLFRGGHPREK